MNAHTKTLLNVSRIASRNGGISLVRAGKDRRNTLCSRLVCPSNRATRQYDILTLRQKINAHASAAHLLDLSGSRFDDTALIQSP